MRDPRACSLIKSAQMTAMQKRSDGLRLSARGQTHA
jgi:hypothetical protein